MWLLSTVVEKDVVHVPNEEYDNVPRSTPAPINVPTVSQTVPIPDKIDISVLNIYDRNNNGRLDRQELQVIETDYHYKRLTSQQVKCFVEVLGHVPTIAPMPTPSTSPTVSHTLQPYLPTCRTDDSDVWYYMRNKPIPVDYYSQGCQLPTDQPMQEYLANSDWIEAYKAGGWDCSQMAAYMEYALENCGYNTVIRRAECEGESIGHAWILVEFSQGWLAYECTGRYWVFPDAEVAKSYGSGYYNPSMYYAGTQYESIYDIWDADKHCRNSEAGFLQEWGWWT